MRHHFYKWIWRNHLKEYEILKVKGWRTFRVKNKHGNTESISCIKWWLK